MEINKYLFSVSFIYYDCKLIVVYLSYWYTKRCIENYDCMIIVIQKAYDSNIEGIK